MIYRKTDNIERITFSPLDNTNSIQFVDLIKFGDICTFGVIADRYFWEFDMSEPSDYERVKMNVYDAIFECDTMSELCEALSSIFEDGFGEILLCDDGDEEEYNEEDEYDNDDESWVDYYEDDEDDEEDFAPHCGCPNCRYKH